MSKTDLRQSKWGNKKAIFQAMVYSLCMAMLCSSVMVHSFAAGTAIISVGQADGKPGDTVAVAISLDTNPGIAALSIKIAYDSTRLALDEPSSVQIGPALGHLSFAGINDVSYANNPFTALWYGAMNDVSAGILLNVAFSVIGNAPAGMAYVDVICGPGDAVDLYEKPVTVSITPGGVEIETPNEPQNPAPGTSKPSSQPSQPSPSNPGILPIVPSPAQPAAAAEDSPADTTVDVPDGSVAVQFMDPSALPESLQAVAAGASVFTILGGDTGSIARVSVPYRLRAGDEPDSLVVCRLDPSGVLAVAALCKYDEPQSVMKMIGNVGEIYIIKHIKTNYGDVADTDWCCRAVSFGTARGLFVGVGDNLFAPQLATTRGMFATVLAKFDDAELSHYTSSPFTDVGIDDWYGPYIAWAMERGLLEGGVMDGYPSNTFDPNGAMTREQLAVLLDNYIRYIGLAPPGNAAPESLETLETLDSLEFSDIGQANGWAHASIRNMRAYGILSGVGDNRFDPKGETTRAEMAQVFANLITALLS